MFYTLIILKNLEHNRVIMQFNLKGLVTTKFYSKFFYGKKIDLMDKVAITLEPDVIISYLKKLNCRDYEKMLERVEKLINLKRKIF